MEMLDTLQGYSDRTYKRWKNERLPEAKREAKEEYDAATAALLTYARSVGLI